MVTRLIKSLQHPIVKHLTKLRKNRAYRDEKQRAIVVGHHLVDELGPFHTLIVDDEKKISPALQSEEIYVATPEILKKITGLSSPEGVAAELSLPPPSSLKETKRVLLLDGISDPGNLGTLLRTAKALGWEGVWISDRCCDLFNDKALRAAKGATFHLPYSNDLKTLDSLLASHTLLIADIKGESIETMTPSSPLILALGNEALGVSDAIKSRGKSVTIPLEKTVESLNVAAAGAILLHHFGRSHER